MASFNCRLDNGLELPGKAVSMEGGLDQVGPWACLWGVILVTLIDVGRPSLQVGGTIAWFWSQTVSVLIEH